MGDTREEVERSERLARVEEQVKGFREDLTDFRTEMRSMWSNVTSLIGNMHKDFYPRNELEKEFRLRDERHDQLVEQVKALREEKKTVNGYKIALWTTLGGAVLGAVVLGLIEWAMKQ